MIKEREGGSGEMGGSGTCLEQNHLSNKSISNSSGNNKILFIDDYKKNTKLNSSKPSRRVIDKLIQYSKELDW